MSFHRVKMWIPSTLPATAQKKGSKMFDKTREKVEEKYLKPVQNVIALIAIVAVAAFVISLMALARSV